MKHSLKIVLVLISMFLVAQIIGLAVTNVYAGNNDDIPFGMNPPEDVNPSSSLLSIVFAIIFAVILMFILMKFKTEMFLRIWFFVVVCLALGITLNALFLQTPLSNNASSISIFIAILLAYLKIFKRNFLVHNATELMIYPGIAAIFIPLLSIPTTIALLIFISIYDIYAVWHAGFMQKMAKYQIKNLKVFSGFFIPYLGKKEAELIKSTPKNKLKGKKIKINLAILGGGDVVFPIILAGVVLRSWGLASALLVTFGAVLGLSYLFYVSKKGKFYPAMPYITLGCFIGLGIARLLTYLL